MDGAADQAERSSAGHNGVESVIRSLGTKEFIRVRLGIHPGHPIRDGRILCCRRSSGSRRRNWTNWSAMRPTRLSSIIAEGVEKAMTKYNRRAQGSTTEEE